MNDFKVGITTLNPGTAGDVEKFRVWNQLVQRANLRYEARGTGTSDGAATWLTIWSATLSENASIGLRAQVVGRGTATAVGAYFEIQAALQDFAGVVTYTAGTFNVTCALADNAFMDVRIFVAGNLVRLDVNDGAVEVMNWAATIEGTQVV